jgi:hypothetical protein
MLPQSQPRYSLAVVTEKVCRDIEGERLVLGGGQEQEDTIPGKDLLQKRLEVLYEELEVLDAKERVLKLAAPAPANPRVPAKLKVIMEEQNERLQRQKDRLERQ